MKKSIITSLLIIVMSMFGTKVYASEVKVVNDDGVTIYYNWINDHTELSVCSVPYGGHEYSYDLVIPEFVEYYGSTYRVTAIGDFAFQNCSELISVTIPNSVTSIGEGAFKHCSSLTSVNIPNNVTSIGKGAFVGTEWYNQQPDGVLYLDNCAIGYKGNLSGELIFADGTRLLSSFNGWSELTSLIIPNSVTSISNSAFWGCSGLSSLAIPESVTFIGDCAFEHCSSLTSIIIPNKVTSIGEYTFLCCSSLTSITIPNSVTSIGHGAFSGCSGLTSITIPESVTSIDRSAFSECSGLTSITIPQSVTSIGGGAFYCDNIRTVKSYITEPYPAANAFSSITQREGILYIPAGTEKLYTRFDGWKDFLKIVEMETSNDPIYLSIQDSQSGTTDLKVKIGENYTFRLSPKDGKNIKNVYFNGRDVTSQLEADNTYTTPSITSNSTLKIVYEGDGPDLNNDGKVDAADVVKLVNIIMGE